MVFSLCKHHTVSSLDEQVIIIMAITKVERNKTPYTRLNEPQDFLETF